MQDPELKQSEMLPDDYTQYAPFASFHDNDGPVCIVGWWYRFNDGKTVPLPFAQAALAVYKEMYMEDKFGMLGEAVHGHITAVERSAADKIVLDVDEEQKSAMIGWSICTRLFDFVATAQNKLSPQIVRRVFEKWEDINETV